MYVLFEYICKNILNNIVSICMHTVCIRMLIYFVFMFLQVKNGNIFMLLF